MDIDQVDQVAPKVRTSTSLVRQARRRIRTQENPNIPLRQLEPPAEFVEQQRQRSSQSPASFRRISNDRYSGSESEDALQHAEIQIKMETSTIQSLSRPRKRIQLPVIINSSEPMRALPLPPAKQKLETKGDNFLPAIDMKSEVQAERDSDDEAELEYDEEDIEVGRLLSKAKLLEGQYDDDIDDSVYGEVEPPAAPTSVKKKRATPTNVSRRLVVLEQDEEGTMYIKAPRSPTNSKKSAKAPIKRFVL